MRKTKLSLSKTNGPNMKSNAAQEEVSPIPSPRYNFESYLFLLPLDLLRIIFSYLDEKSLCKFARVCKKAKEFANDDFIWKEFYKRKFKEDVLENKNGGIWKDAYIRYSNIKFGTCHKEIDIVDGGSRIIKHNHKYSVALGNLCFSSGTHSWEIEILSLKSSQCICVGFVNDSKLPFEKTSESHGSFGHYKFGYGMFIDGERCHDQCWITTPHVSPYTVGDKVGIRIIFKENSNLADAEFFVNGSLRVGAGFKNVPGPLWAAVSLMDEGSSVRIKSGISNEINT